MIKWRQRNERNESDEQKDNDHFLRGFLFVRDARFRAALEECRVVRGHVYRVRAANDNPGYDIRPPLPVMKRSSRNECERQKARRC